MSKTTQNMFDFSKNITLDFVCFALLLTFYVHSEALFARYFLPTSKTENFKIGDSQIMMS